MACGFPTVHKGTYISMVLTFHGDGTKSLKNTQGGGGGVGGSDRGRKKKD